MSEKPTKSLKACIDEAVAHLRTCTALEPEVGLVLGSGLGPLAERIQSPVSVPFEEIPHFAESTVSGHQGRLIFGELEGRKVVALQGRYHMYEGYPPEVVTFPIRVFRALDIKVLVLSNAAGGLNRHYRTGDLMIIEDHIDWMHVNPLVGPNEEELGPRFPSLAEPYTRRLVDLAQEVGRELGLRVQQGVLLSIHGPNYETQASLRMFRRGGADAIGMSVIPEAIVAQHAGIPEVLGVTCITDMATGEDAESISHEQVLAAARSAEVAFTSLIEGVMKRL